MTPPSHENMVAEEMSNANIKTVRQGRPRTRSLGEMLCTVQLVCGGPRRTMRVWTATEGIAPTKRMPLAKSEDALTRHSGEMAATEKPMRETQLAERTDTVTTDGSSRPHSRVRRRPAN